ncbi:MAG: hypothetical protein U0350_02870 [Caldilineaceae bacterium]
MIQLNFEELVQIVQALKPEQKRKLAERIKWSPTSSEPTRAQLIKELHRLRTSDAFAQVESLYGKFANPTSPDLSAEDLNLQLHEISTEWEQELDKSLCTF